MEKDEKSPETKRNDEVLLNTEDLGAGYDIEDKRIARAIKFYQSELLPYLKENCATLRLGNFLEIKGYGTNIKKKYVSNTEQTKDSSEGHRSKKLRHDNER